MPFDSHNRAELVAALVRDRLHLAKSLDVNVTKKMQVGQNSLT